VTEVRVVSDDGTVAATSFPGIEVMDCALSKILRAEETGDSVSDL
jgi:hypothetical protein